MQKTVILCLLVASLAYCSEAFRQRKRQEEKEEVKCCLPSKYALKLTTIYNSEIQNEDGEIERNDFSYSEYKVVDGNSAYSASSLASYGSLVVYTGKEKQFVSHDSSRKCFTIWGYETDYTPGKDCLFLPYAGSEEKDNTNYSVFRTSSTSEDGSWSTEEVYATIDESGDCYPRLGVSASAHPHDNNATHKSVTTQKYKYMQVTPKLQKLLVVPPASNVCPEEKPETTEESEESNASEAEAEAPEAAQADAKRSPNSKRVYVPFRWQ